MNLILILMLGAIWGVAFTIARFATTNGVPPLGYAFWQSAGPAIVLLIIVKINHLDIPLTRQHLFFYLFCGIFGIALPNTNMYFVAPHLPAGILAVVVNTSALVIYVLSLATQLENFIWLRFLGVLSAIIGVMLIIIPKVSLPSAATLPWVFMGLLTPFCFAITTLYIVKRQPKNSNILNLSAGMLLTSAIILAPIVFFSHNYYPLTLPLTLPKLVILLEIALSSCGYLLLFKILKTAGTVYYSLIGPLVVISGIVWGRIILNEHIDYHEIIAAFFVIAGIIMVTLKQKQELNREKNTATNL